MFLPFEFRAFRGGKILNRGGRKGFAEVAKKIYGTRRARLISVGGVRWVIYERN